MSPWKILTKLLLIMLLALLASGVVNAKVASGLQNLSGIVHPGESVVNALMHQGKTESSYGGMSGSSVVTKGGVNTKPFYRYVGEGEADVIRRTGSIPNVDRSGNLKDVYITNRKYTTAGRAKTYNQLPNKPSYRIEIDPANIKGETSFTRVNPTDNPQWGVGGGVEATTRSAIPVDPSTLVKLKGAPR